MTSQASVAIGAILLLFTTASGATSCLEPDQIRETDRRYEAALLHGGCAFLTGLLAEDFVWVHSDARATDTRQTLLESMCGDRPRPSTISRVSSNVEVRQKGDAAVVSGFTTVKRRGWPPSARYHFMRTYVRMGDKCELLANHTMLLSDEKELR